MAAKIKKKKKDDFGFYRLYVTTVLPVGVYFVPKGAWREFLDNVITGGDEIKDEYPESVGHCITFKESNNLCVAICFNTEKFRELKETPNEIVGVIAHEAVHVWQSIRDWIGEEKPSIELEAYIVQSITRDLINCLEQEGVKFKINGK